MAFGFATFEKLKELYNKFVGFIWKICPLLALIAGVKWWLLKWFPQKAINALDWLQSRMPAATHINIQTVGVAWSRINQWVPVTEIMIMGSIYLGLCAAVAVVKWGAKVV